MVLRGAMVHDAFPSFPPTPKKKKKKKIWEKPNWNGVKWGNEAIKIKHTRVVSAPYRRDWKES